MYLHLGQDTIVNERDIVGVFDMDNSTISRHTRDFLSKAQREARVLHRVPDKRPGDRLHLPDLYRYPAAPGFRQSARGLVRDLLLDYWERLVWLCSISESPNAPIAGNGSI